MTLLLETQWQSFVPEDLVTIWRQKEITSEKPKLLLKNSNDLMKNVHQIINTHHGLI